jgi:hypothetical protein
MPTRAHQLIEDLGFKIQREGPNKRYPIFGTHYSEVFRFWCTERSGAVDFGVQANAGTKFTDETVARLEVFGFHQSMRKPSPNQKAPELFVSLPTERQDITILAAGSMALVERLSILTEQI